MPRSLLALPVLALLLTTVLAAPVPKEKPKLYFPTKVGAKWVYDDAGGEITVTVTRVRTTDGATVVTVSRVDRPGAEPDVEMKVADDGLFQLTGLGAGHTPSHRLKLPHTDGQSWTTYTGAWPSGTSEFTARSEKLRVVAGEFETIRVDATDARRGSTDVRRTFWYAPGVGLVKAVMRIGEDTSTRVLKSFTPGKR
jgi:hypothetical protein